MPRYFFNVYDGQSSPDEDGTALPDLEIAKIEGLRLAGAIIHESAIDTGQEWRIEVADETGLVLFRMDFSLMQSPALSSHAAAAVPKMDSAATGHRSAHYGGNGQR